MSCDSVLLLADEEAGFEPLGECLSGLNYQVRPALVMHVDMFDRVSLADNKLIVLNARTLNALHHSVLLAVQQLAPCPVVVFTKHSDEDSILLSVNAGANSIIIDGIECRRVPGILKIAQARFQRSLSLRKELLDAQKKLRDKTNLDHARRLLMSRKGMDEGQASRFLHKMARDNQQPVGDLATQYIELEGLLD